MTFEDFLRAEMGALSRVAGALTGDPHLAEDLLSDALLVAFARWPRISKMEFPSAYVRRIVVTTFLSERRKSGRRRTRTTNDIALLDQPKPDCGESISDRDEVRRLLATLPVKQRTAIVLRYLLDQTDDQIAEIMGCTAGTVRAHLSHARATLRLVTDSYAKAGEQYEH